MPSKNYTDEFHRRAVDVCEVPNLAATRVFGTCSAANVRINDQSSKLTTLRSSNVHSSPLKLLSFRAPPTASRFGEGGHAGAVFSPGRGTD